MKKRVYLDWNATARLRPEARAAMSTAMDIAGNPSSVHAEGRQAKALVEKARGEIAACLGCRPQDIIFTSGATEAAQVLSAWPGPVIADPTAHDAIWSQHRPVGDGQAIHAYGMANSETGLIAEAPEANGACVLADLTQAVGRVPLAFNWIKADFAILSAHKFGGPKGVGALLVRDGREMPALAVGGGQEMGRRSGTENLIGIAGFAAALLAAMAELEDGAWARVAEARDKLEADMKAAIPEALIVGENDKRLPNTSCVIVPGWKGETQVMQMDLAGFAISAGSACSSGKVKPSRVLQAMGFDEKDAASAIRVSFGPETTEQDLSEFVAAWSAAYERHQARAA